MLDTATMERYISRATNHEPVVAPWIKAGGYVIKSPDEDFLVKNGLDWDIEKRPLYYRHNGELVESEEQSLVRVDTGKELSVVTRDWHPVRNRVSFEFFRDLAREGKAELTSCGTADDDRLVWLLAKTNQSFGLFKGKDEIESYLHFSTSHRYGVGTILAWTSVRLWCMNQHRMALSKNNCDLKVNLHHRTQFDSDKVSQMVTAAMLRSQEYREQATLLSERRYTNEDLGDYFRAVFHPRGSTKMEFSPNAALAISSMVSQPGAAMGLGTWWQVWNAVTYTVDHLLGQGVGTRLMSSWFGHGQRTKKLALDLALDYASRSPRN